VMSKCSSGSEIKIMISRKKFCIFGKTVMICREKFLYFGKNYDMFGKFFVCPQKLDI
jgi:hypothetical protein